MKPHVDRASARRLFHSRAVRIVVCKLRSEVSSTVLPAYKTAINILKIALIYFLRKITIPFSGPNRYSI